MLLQLIYNKFDEVGIVVFGTQGPSLSILFLSTSVIEAYVKLIWVFLGGALLTISDCCFM